MTSQPRIFTPVVAEEVDEVLGVDCFAAFFLVMVKGETVLAGNGLEKESHALGQV